MNHFRRRLLPLLRLRSYLEIAGIITVVTTIAWFIPADYRVFGDVYLLTVILLCFRYPPRPVFFGTVASVLAWNFVIVPPRMSFSRLDVKDGVFLGTYFLVALIAGQLTSRLRAQQQLESRREREMEHQLEISRALHRAAGREEGLHAAARCLGEKLRCPVTLLLEGEPEAFRTIGEPLPVEWVQRSTLLAPAGASLVSMAPSLTGYALATAHKEDRRDWLVLQDRKARLDAHLSLIQGAADQIARFIEQDRHRTAHESIRFFAESDRLHRTLLDSASHELRTPVTVLRTALDQLATADEMRRQLIVLEMRTATDRLQHLVANLLNQSRLEAGRLQATLDWCDVRDIVAVAKPWALAAKEQHRLRLRLPTDLPLIRADPALMEQVLGNLLLNAARYAPTESPIEVSGRVDTFVNQVLIEVADHGPGLAADVRQRLFQKFTRDAGGTAGGLGLGLSIVKGFMLCQGGDVHYEDREGGGARFILSFPYLNHALVPWE